MEFKLCYSVWRYGEGGTCLDHGPHIEDRGERKKSVLFLHRVGCMAGASALPHSVILLALC